LALTSFSLDDMATLAISLGADAAKIGLGQLLGHSVRLKDATNENSAATSAIPAFTQDVQEVVAAFNKGTLDAAEATSFLQQQQQAVYTFLKKQVGPAGTAWKEGGGSCDKTCTVGCCLYYTFVNVVANRFYSILQAASYPATLKLPQTFSSKYGYPGSPSLSLTINPPTINPLVSLLGGTESVPGSVTATTTSAPTGQPNGLLAKLGFPNVSTMDLLVGGAALATIIVAAVSLRGSR
jgi:hypothetical protein